MGGGGKGGSSSSSAEIPSWIAQPATRNLARAEQIAKIGYQPYYGADIAAFNPTQEAVMQSNVDAAKAFGLVPQDMQALEGMPEPTTFAGGIQGYSASPLYDQAVAELAVRNPEQAALYNSLFVGDGSNVSTGYGAPEGYTYAKNSYTGQVQLIPSSQVGTSINVTPEMWITSPYSNRPYAPVTATWEQI